MIVSNNQPRLGRCIQFQRIKLKGQAGPSHASGTLLSRAIYTITNSDHFR